MNEQKELLSAVQSLQEQVRFLVQNSASKQDLLQTKSEITTLIDGFIRLHQKLDLEQAALRDMYFRHEHYLEQLSKHLDIKLPS